LLKRLSAIAIIMMLWRSQICVLGDDNAIAFPTLRFDWGDRITEEGGFELAKVYELWG
jgi:hypothetical protein